MSSVWWCSVVMTCGIFFKLRRKNISMLHLSTGIAVQNKIHAPTERGSRNVRNETEWNGEANEEIGDRNGVNPWACRRCRCGRYARPSTGAAAPGGRLSVDRQGPNW